MLHVAQLGMFGDAATVKALQQALRARGKTNIVVSGVVDGPTVAGVFEIIRDNLATKLGTALPSDVKDAVAKMQSFDADVRKFTFNQFNSASLIANSATVISLVRSVSAPVADALQKAVNALFSTVNTRAPTITTVVTALAPTTPAAAAATAAAAAAASVPFYKKPLFWTAVAGSVVVVGGGALLLRR